MSCGDLSVLCAPLRTGAAHIVRFGPVPAHLICHCGPPGIGHSGARLHNRGGENVSYVREVLQHPKSSMIGIGNVQISAYEFERDARPSA